MTGSVIAGRAVPGVIVQGTEQPPVMLNSIASRPTAPATHSPTAPPDAVLVTTEVIASRSVQTPSFAAVSAVLVTVMTTPAESEAAHDRKTKTRDPQSAARCGRRHRWSR